jgi:hypothetical protein
MSESAYYMATGAALAGAAALLLTQSTGQSRYGDDTVCSARRGATVPERAAAPPAVSARAATTGEWDGVYDAPVSEGFESTFGSSTLPAGAKAERAAHAAASSLRRDVLTETRASKTLGITILAPGSQGASTARPAVTSEMFNMSELYAEARERGAGGA